MTSCLGKWDRAGEVCAVTVEPAGKPRPLPSLPPVSALNFFTLP
jgi:hypothetical protein